ncbi:hypothetical protein [Shewanella sp.]|uniref:hypothetical protein n=2 Tax=Shewanella sp. TaxID=50422 RepID=UPI00405498FF
MIIKSVLLDKKRYKLVSSGYCNDNNAFTIIVGSNGTGKSRLLKRIVNNIKNLNSEGEEIPRNYSKHLHADNEGEEVTFFSPSSESNSYLGTDKDNIISVADELKVIAVTTTPFDKFPVEYKGNSIYRYHNDNRYTYIGLKVSKNALNQSNFLNLLSRSMLSSSKVFSNSKLFSLLNLNNNSYIQFKTKLPSKPLDLKILNHKTGHFSERKFTKDVFLEYIRIHQTTIYDNIRRDSNLISIAYNAYNKCFPFLSKDIDPEGGALLKKS